MNELVEIINTVLRNAGKPVANSISEQTHLRNDLGFDSFNLAELTVRIEEKFNCDVFEEGLVNTIGEIKERLNIS